jgi:hypothetical protein
MLGSGRKPVLPIFGPPVSSQEAPFTLLHSIAPAIDFPRRRSQPALHFPPPDPKPARPAPLRQISRPPTPSLEIDEPPPEMYIDTETGRYGVRCICERQVNEGVMIQCDKCKFWVHALCVNIPKVSASDRFFCPFCRKRPIRCSCGQSRKYNEQIIQCQICRYWVHKSCAELGYGRNPARFVCKGCNGTDPAFPNCSLNASSTLRDFAVAVAARSEILDQIPEGAFRSDLTADLNSHELPFFQTVSRYFNKFCEPLFDEDALFWKTFTDVFTQLFGCARETIFAAIDFLACQLLYKSVAPEPAGLFVALDRFTMSERASLEFKSPNLPKCERASLHIVASAETGRPCVSASVPDGGFIAEVPGFLCHYDELPAAGGLALHWISIPNSEYVIDTDQTSFVISRRIRRSFHFNCEPRFVKLGGETRVALVGRRLQGPAADAAPKRATAIPEGGEIVLPLDADLPYPVPRVEWRDRRAKKVPPKPERKRPGEQPASLLALFYDAAVPPLPLQVMSSEELSEKEKIEAIRASERISTRKSFRRGGE